MTYLTLACVVSFVAAFLAFASIFLIFSGNLFLASLLLIVCVILDFLDGKVARLMNQASDFGKQIDSLVDVLCFGVAPALLLASTLILPWNFLPFLIVLGGIYRLARYNVENQNTHFKGMPITANGLIVPIFYLSGFLNMYTSMGLSIVLFVLMVSTLRIKKIF